MKWKTKFIETMKRYKHAWVFLYALIYMPWFWFLEKHVTMNYHVVQTALDEEIPFIEYFIVPYMLWFVFIAATFLYFFVTDVQGFYKLAKISFAVFERDNIFVDAVRMLYRTDTCTNVFPSLHVFNTLCACIAIHKSQALKKHKAVCIGAYVLGALIIMATMFLKQHSVLDVTGAFIMAYLLYQWVYAEETKKVPGYSKRPVFQNK